MKANWFTTQNLKTMVNNELPSSKRTNQERPYEQLLHYQSRHLQAVLEQYFVNADLVYSEPILEDGDDFKIPGKGLPWNYLMILNVSSS